MDNGSYYELGRDFIKDDLIALNGPTIYPSHFHQCSEITYMLQGTCSAVINSAEYLAERDDILFVPGYYSHSYRTSDDTLRYNVLPTEGMENDFLQIIQKKVFACLLDDKVFNREKLRPLLQEMHAVQTSRGTLPGNTRWLLLKGLTDTMYGRLLEGYSSRLLTKSKRIDSMVEILTYIEEHSQENITLESISSHFGYNKYYFSKFFNAHIGDNLNNYVNGNRIRTFLRLYENASEKNILRLAFEAGFNSMPSFYRSFQRIYKCTPKEYFEKLKR